MALGHCIIANVAFSSKYAAISISYRFQFGSIEMLVANRHSQVSHATAGLRQSENGSLIQQEMESQMKSFFGCLAVVLWISMSAQGLQAQAACTLPGEVEATLKQLGITLPAAAAPVANYVQAVRTGNLIFLAGTASKNLDGTFITGKVGADLTADQGYQAARMTGIFLLSSLKAAVGDLNKVTRIVKVVGFVNADPTFTQHPAVVNGVSDLMGQVFGDCGKHARSAAGMSSLPSNVAVETEMVVEVASSGPATPSVLSSAVAYPKGLATSNLQVRLDGTASTSSDGKPLSYSWTQPASSPFATISGATTATPLVQFSGGPGIYTFTLTVTDDTGKTATDTASVTFEVRPH
jgi:enamine deaminase RidA (YjgF/YER057c/UK114 family)